MSASHFPAVLLSVSLNSSLVRTARRAAREIGLPLQRFIAEVVEADLATRRCRELPAPFVPDPPDSPWIRRPKGIDANDLHGPLNDFALWLPRRK